MNTLLARIRDRIIADFRDFRFSWGDFFRWTGIVLAAIFFAALITLYFLDWNQLRGPISRYASAKLGRDVRIDGDLKVDLFRWQPHILVGGLHIGNPAWVGRPVGADVKRVEMEFRLWPALFGTLILPLVEIDQPNLLVVRDANGRTNWDRTHSGNAPGWQIPPIRRFVIDNGHIEIDDAVRELHFIGTVSSRERVSGTPAAPAINNDHANAFQLTGSGTLNGNIFLADVRGGPLINVDPDKPYAFASDIHAGATHAVIDGAVTRPFHLDNFGGHVSVTGDSLSNLYYLIGLPLPGTPPYRIAASLKRDGNFFSLTDMSGQVGSSDLHGNLTVDVSGRLPELHGHLYSRVLNLEDLGALLRSGKTASETGPYLLPDVTLHTERMRELNGEIDYGADAVRSRDIPLRGLTTHISVKNGVLILKPLAFAFTQGKLSGSVSIDGRKDVPTISADARITDIHIEQFIKGNDKPVQGTMEARAQLSGRGTSVHKAAAAASGTFTAVIPSGQIRHSLAEWLGINVISALGLNLASDTTNTGLRCAVAHFDVQNGVLTAQQFVVDTDPVRVEGHGTINLGDETMDLTLAGKPKSFQFFRLRAPVTISGKLASPTVGIKTGTAVAQGVIGAGLALFAPPAAILAFIDPGLAKDANCAGLLSTAQEQGAPVSFSRRAQKRTTLP
jgi:uncharacterized protein involved in outer membrane biogenesis